MPEKPKISERKIGKEAAYETSQTEDMSGHGWVKELTFKYLTIQENDKILCTEYDFYAKDVNHQCGSSEYLWLIPEKTAPFLGCTWCKTTETLSKDVAIKRKEYEVTPNQAVAILIARGYKKSSPPVRPYVKLARKTSPRLASPRDRPRISQ